MQVINEVRDLLFNEVVPGVGGGQDLIALDIERGRDHGIGSYNQVRVGLGLPAVTSFAQITSNVQVQQELRRGLRQRQQHRRLRGRPGRGPGSRLRRRSPVPDDHGRSVHAPCGTATASSTSTRRGRPQELAIFQQGNTLAKVIEANTDITNLQSDVFMFKASISGSVFLDHNGGSGPLRQRGVAGITVELTDASGDVLATTKTNAFGQYIFNQLSGPAANPENASGVSAVGDYNVVLVLPSGVTQVSANPATIQITRGGQNVTGVNFLVTSAKQGTDWGPDTTDADALFAEMGAWRSGRFG